MREWTDLLRLWGWARSIPGSRSFSGFFGWEECCPCWFWVSSSSSSGSNFEERCGPLACDCQATKRKSIDRPVTTFYLDTPGSRPRTEAQKGKGKKRGKEGRKKFGMKDVFFPGGKRKEHALLTTYGIVVVAVVDLVEGSLSILFAFSSQEGRLFLSTTTSRPPVRPYVNPPPTSQSIQTFMTRQHNYPAMTLTTPINNDTCFSMGCIEKRNGQEATVGWHEDEEFVGENGTKTRYIHTQIVVSNVLKYALIGSATKAQPAVYQAFGSTFCSLVYTISSAVEPQIYNNFFSSTPARVSFSRCYPFFSLALFFFIVSSFFPFFFFLIEILCFRRQFLTSQKY